MKKWIALLVALPMLALSVAPAAALTDDTVFITRGRGQYVSLNALNMNTGQVTKLVSMDPGTITGMGVSQDEQRVAWTKEGGAISLFDHRSNTVKTIAKPSSNYGTYFSDRFTWDGKVFYRRFKKAGTDEVVKPQYWFYNPSTASKIQLKQSYGEQIATSVYSPNGKYRVALYTIESLEANTVLASEAEIVTSSGKTIDVDLPAGLNPHSMSKAAAFSPDSKNLVMAFEDFILYVDPATGEVFDSISTGKVSNATGTQFRQIEWVSNSQFVGFTIGETISGTTTDPKIILYDVSDGDIAVSTTIAQGDIRTMSVKGKNVLYTKSTGTGSSDVQKVYKYSTTNGTTKLVMTSKAGERLSLIDYRQ